jgi:TonB family protein
MNSATVLLLFALSGTQQVRIGTIPTIPNGVVLPPQIVSSPIPEYTEEARLAGIEGIVTVDAAFDIYGNVKPLRVRKGLGYGLDAVALATLTGWRFLPATRNGAPVEVVAQVDVVFRVVHRIGGGISAPMILSKVDPRYPPEAKAKRIQGTVVLEAIVLDDGSVQLGETVKSVDPTLDAAARQALEQWKFKPAQREGAGVNVGIKIEINFNLR